jgi:UPF0271 protein
VDTFDLNADVGESFGAWILGDDEAVLGLVTSANVACGFHAGDPRTLRKACATAAANGVAIGAQVGYRDLAGFGRRFVDVDPSDLADDVLYQLGALDAFARVAGTRVAYVKPHGALYHCTVDDAAQAGAVVDAVRSYEKSLTVLGFPGSELLKAASAAGLPTEREAFADRAYGGDGRLVDRRVAGAVLHDPAVIAARVLRLAQHGEIEAVDGTVLRVDARSVCVHGDTPGAVDVARAVRDALTGAGIGLSSFVAV